MKRMRKWVLVVVAVGLAGMVLAIWLSSRLSSCQYRESTPSYSPDEKFYTQMQFTICRDDSRSRARLVLGEAGKQEKTVLLDLGSRIGTVDLSWREGPELHIKVPESAITKRYGPYDEPPRIVITNP